MEAFALFFTTGAADEKVAFSSVGKTFYNTTYGPLPDIVQHIENGHYNNIYKLFLLWHGRIESEKLLKEKNEIESRISKVNDRYISPYGTR